MAAGGSASPFRPYWVGEAGRELVVPETLSRVIPNIEAEKMARGLGGSNVYLGPITIHESGDPKKTLAAVRQGVSDAVARRLGSEGDD